MKRNLLLFLVALLPMMASAYDAQIDGIYYNLSGNEATVTYKDHYYNAMKGNVYISNYSGTVIIPDSVTYNDMTYSVTSIDYFAFNDCSSLTSVKISSSVTNIGYRAFYCCTGLTSITIPSSVMSIGTNSDPSVFSGCSGLTSIKVEEGNTYYDSRNNCNAIIETSSNRLIAGCNNTIIPENVTCICDGAFYNCNGLTSVIIPESVTSIGRSAFEHCSSLTSITIPNSVASIGVEAFIRCSSLTSVTIPRNVKSIGIGAFWGCDSLTSVTLESDAIVSTPRTYDRSMSHIFGYQVKTYVIGDTVKGIGDYAFYSCSSLTSINIPDSVTNIGSNAFQNCSGLTSITIPNSVTNIGNQAFEGCNIVIFYANRGTDGLLSLWNYGINPYEIGSDKLLSPPSISVLSTTQTTITYCINNKHSEFEYKVEHEFVDEDTYMIKGLRPSYIQNIPLKVLSANNSYRTSTNATTSPINPTVICKNKNASSLSLQGSYSEGDAKVLSSSLTIDGREIEGKIGTIYGLDPNTAYNSAYKVVVEYGDGYTYTYEGSSNIKTENLILETQLPMVISVGNVIVAARSNLDDEETKVGFEWRRTDWTDEFATNCAVAYLYEGTMEGYIRNLYAEKLWKYRPYYEANSGNRYYGDWVGIDPTNTSYFEPTVHTYATITVTGNRAEVRGYAMRGTDNIVTQGFMYWPNGSSYSLRKKAASIPSDAITVTTAKTNIMTATLEDLEYETTYNYVAFVTTSEYETFFGEVQTFSTEVDPDGINEIKNESLTPALSKGEGDWYSLDGRKMVNGKLSNGKLPRGINIIRYSDGTTRKILVR